MSLFSPRSLVDYFGEEAAAAAAVTNDSSTDAASIGSCGDDNEEFVLKIPSPTTAVVAADTEFEFPSLFTYSNRNRNNPAGHARNAAAAGPRSQLDLGADEPMMMIRGPPRVLRSYSRQDHVGNPFFAPICDLDDSNKASEPLRPRPRLMQRNTTNRSLFSDSIIRPSKQVASKKSSALFLKPAAYQQQTDFNDEFDNGVDESSSSSSELVHFHEVPPTTDGVASGVIRPVARRCLRRGSRDAASSMGYPASSMSSPAAAASGVVVRRIHFQPAVSSPFRSCCGNV